MSKEKNRWPHLANLPLPPVKDVDITVLLGADVFDLIVPVEMRTGPKGTPRAVRTALGWTATCRLPGSSDINTVTAMKVHITTPEEDLSHQVQLWWKTESFGCKYGEETSRSVEDKKALEILESTTKHTGNRYETALLWKEDDACYTAQQSRCSRETTLLVGKEISSK
jgi:hypothetical protein